MAEEVVKTIKDVDKLFSQIIVNGEVHESSRFRKSSTPSTLRQSSIEETEIGEDISAVVLNNVQHNIEDESTMQLLNNEIAEREQADYDLQVAVNAITAKIPVQATSENQLADKNYVNSAVATDTANFLGTYTSMAQIEAIPHPTNNDYAYLRTTDTEGNNIYKRYKYNSEDSEWLYEYEFSNPSFTAEQWATINSGLDASSIPNAINALDTNEIGGNGKLIQAVAETNGIIRATPVDIAGSVTPADTKPVSGGAVASAISDEATNRNTAINTAMVSVYNTLRGVHSADITAVLNAGGYIRLQAGSYVISSNVSLPAGTVIEGDNPDTTIINCSSVNGYAITMTSNCQIKGVRLTGDISARPANADGTHHGIGIGTASYASNNCLIDNVKVSGFSGFGIHGVKSDGMYIYRVINKLSNVEVDTCGAGVIMSLNFQYSQSVNCSFCDSYIGGAIHEGNNMFVGCQFNGNVIGLNMNGAESPNWNAHGVFSGCQFNHNSSALQLVDITAGQIFTGCVIFYGTWLIVRCQGVQFVGCELAWLNTESFSMTDSTGVNTLADNYIVSHPATKTITGVLPTTSNNKDTSNNEFAVCDNTPTFDAHGGTVVKRDANGNIRGNYLGMNCPVEADAYAPTSGSFIFSDDYGWIHKCSNNHLLRLLGIVKITDTLPTTANGAKNIALPAGWTVETTFIASYRAWRTSAVVYTNADPGLVAMYFDNGYIELVLSQTAFDIGMAGQRIDLLLVHL